MQGYHLARSIPRNQSQVGPLKRKEWIHIDHDPSWNPLKRRIDQVRQVHRAQGHIGSNELYIRRHVADWETSNKLELQDEQVEVAYVIIL